MLAQPVKTAAILLGHVQSHSVVEDRVAIQDRGVPDVVFHLDLGRPIIAGCVAPDSGLLRSPCLLRVFKGMGA